MLRVGNALVDKANSFLNYKNSGIVKVEDISILAIDISQLLDYDDPPGDPNLLFKVLTGIHTLQLIINLGTNETSYEFSRKHPVKTGTKNGNIEMDWRLEEIDKKFTFNVFLYNSCPFVVPSYKKLDYISIDNTFKFHSDEFINQSYLIEKTLT